MPEKLPRGALLAAQVAINKAATDFGHGDLVCGGAEDLSRAVLEAALPFIERSVRRDMARHILFLDEVDHKRTHNRGPFYDMKTSLRRAARGEALPDVDAALKEVGGDERPHAHPVSGIGERNG